MNARTPSVLHAYTLAAVTLAVLVLLAIRPNHEPWLVWNLFLAWIPYVCARALWRTAHRSYTVPLVAPLAVLWLLFLPNAPYLVTDLVHMQDHLHGPRLALEYGVFGTAALAGVLLGVASLQPVHRLVAERIGRRAARAFPPVVALAVALGVYLGRVQRWNSWAAFQTPGTLLHDTWAVLGHPVGHPRAYLGIALFTAAFLLAYEALTAAPVASASARSSDMRSGW